MALHKWNHIAKAEFFVLTHRMRRHRRLYVGIICALVVLWSVYIGPLLVGGLLNSLIPMSEIRALLVLVFPGLMRSVMLFLWLVLFLFPMSNALEEIRIGQWELILSRNVRTRDILIGVFVGRVPLYGLTVFLLAPIMISPFMQAYEVSIVGQVLVYLVIMITAISAIWLSTLVTSMIQARLGSSPRGNDLGKALSIIVALIVIVPMYGLMFFLPRMSEVMGINVLLLLPSTWSADTITWITLLSNGIGLNPTDIQWLTDTLQLDIFVSALLVAGFLVLCVTVGILSADRVFTVTSSVQHVRTMTVGGENVLLRSVRRMFPGPRGALIATSIKEFVRRAENLTRMGYGIVLAIILPAILSNTASESRATEMIFIMTVLLMAFVGAIPFAGTGFLESEDQLWMILTVPQGVRRFVISRLVGFSLILLPVVTASVAATMVVIGGVPGDFVTFCICSCGSAMGGMLTATGITASNPNYRDTKSPAHQMNLLASIFVPMIILMGWFAILAVLARVTGIDVFGLLGGYVGTENIMTVVTLQAVVVLLLLGGVLLRTGVRRLTARE